MSIMHEKMFKNKQKTLAYTIVLCILKKSISNNRRAEEVLATPHIDANITTTEIAIMLKTILYCVELIYQHQIIKICKEFLFFDLFFGSRYGPTVNFI
jgi:hypothetical protein